MLLAQPVNEFWFNKLKPIVATTTGYYDAAGTLPQLHKMETFLEVIENQRARHLLRHPELDINAIFSEHDMNGLHTTWLGDHKSWMNAEKLNKYEKVVQNINICLNIVQHAKQECGRVVQNMNVCDKIN